MEIDTLWVVQSPRAENGTIDGPSATEKLHISIVTAAQNTSVEGQVWHTKTQHAWSSLQYL
jgi:hypothetical protein